MHSTMMKWQVKMGESENAKRRTCAAATVAAETVSAPAVEVKLYFTLPRVTTNTSSTEEVDKW